VRVGEADFLPGLILPAVLELEGFDKPRLSVAWGDALSIQGSGGKELRIPIDDGGRLRLDFPGPWATVIPHYAAVDVIRAAESSDTLAQAKQAFGGKIVVVANATTGSGDVGATPTDARYPLGELHAVLAENLFARRFLREVSGWVGAALAPLFAGGASTLLLTMATGRGVALALLPLLGLIGAAWGLGLAGILLPVVLPGLGWGVGLVGTLGYRHWSGERERRRLVAAFTGYLPPQVIRRVLEEPDRDPLKVRRKELSVLFADIQGFTSLTDQVEPEVIRGILSEYFEAMTEIIFAQQGTLDKFMGDGLLAFFGDAEDAPDHAERAVRAALAMQRRVRELADGWVAKGLEPLRVRVGVNTGYVTVGNLGSPRRMDYTVIGREVNLASRIQSAAVPGGVLISRRTHALVQGIPLKTTHQQIEAKGFSHPIDVYGVEVE
jgi:adenylate cyclase